MVNVMLDLSVSSRLVTYQGVPEREIGGGGRCVRCLCVLSLCMLKVQVSP